MSGQPTSRSLPAAVGRHAAEIEALKRKVLGPDPDAIRFNFANGSATDRWLLIRTGDPAPPGGLPAIYLHDDGGAGVKILAGAGGNLELNSNGGNLILAGNDGASLTSGGPIDIDSGGALQIVAGADTTLTTTGDTTVVSHGGITLTAGTSGLTSPDGILGLFGYDGVQIQCSIGDIGIDVSNGGSPGDRSLTVTSNAASPTELFRVDSAGHIFMRHLPTSDPGTGDGQLWRNGQVVTVST